jgi:hypothetical protein
VERLAAYLRQRTSAEGLYAHIWNNAGRDSITEKF